MEIGNRDRTVIVSMLAGLGHRLRHLLRAAGLVKSTYYHLLSHPAAVTRPDIEPMVAEIFARTPNGCVCSIESGPCERVDVFHVSGRFWSTSACGEKRTPARPAWTSFPS